MVPVPSNIRQVADLGFKPVKLGGSEYWIDWIRATHPQYGEIVFHNPQADRWYAFHCDAPTWGLGKSAKEALSRTVNSVTFPDYKIHFCSTILDAPYSMEKGCAGLGAAMDLCCTRHVSC